MKKLVSIILMIAIICTSSFSALAESIAADRSKSSSAGDVFTFTEEITWAEAGKQIAGMLSCIVEDAADIDLTVHSARISGLSLEDDSVYLAILAENGYLPEAPEMIDPTAIISPEEYVQLLEIAFPTIVGSQDSIDGLLGVENPGNIAVMGENLSISALLPGRIAVSKADHLSITAVNAPALSLNAKGSVYLSESEIARVHISDIAAGEEVTEGEEIIPEVIYLHMDSGTQIPEIIVKNADEVLIEGSGALGVVRVQEQVASLTVRATASVVNETEEMIEVTGPDAEVVTLQPGEQIDFVLSKWLVSFVTEGTPVQTQEVAPGGTVNFAQANTELDGKVFTAWYEDAAFTQPYSRLSSVNKQTTLYARFIDESDAVTVTFETFGGRELAPMVFAKGEYLLTKPVESLYTAKDGYSFGGWCVDEECTMGFGYLQPIEESMTLYALYSSHEQEVREEPGTVAAIELPDGSATIPLALPEDMSVAEAKESFVVESGTGAVVPEIAIRETENGAELYCEVGFIPGTSFTLYAQNGVRFAGYQDYIDTLVVSVYREQMEIVEFAEDMTYILWDEVVEYTPVSESDLEYTVQYTEGMTEYNMLEDHDAEGEVIPGRLVMTGEANFEKEQIVVFYDGEINDDEATIDAWEGGDLAGHVLFAEIDSVQVNEDGQNEVTFYYADPEKYVTALDVHTTEEVNIEELIEEEQIAQLEKSIASQLASNDELKAQMLVAVMTSGETQQMLDDEYGAGVYSLASLMPVISDPKLDIDVSVKDSTAKASIGVGVTVALYNLDGLLVELSPYLFFEQQLTLDMNVDGGFLWIDMSILFRTKSTIRLELSASTGGKINLMDEALETLREVINADGTATEGYDYQEAADTLMNTMQQLAATELNYQDLFAVPLLKLKKSFKGIITVGVRVELVGQAAVIASFGVEVMAEYGQKVGFNYNFLTFKGGSYKEKLASEVTTEVYIIGKLGTRVGISLTLYIKMLQKVTVSITGTVFAYVELAGMFLYTYALSAGGGNHIGALYLEVGVDIEIMLTVTVKMMILGFKVTIEKNWVVWSHRWKLYSMSRGMTMSVIQNTELDEMWKAATVDANYKTSYPFLYLPMKTYDMLDGSCTENQLLFGNLQEGNVTAKLTLEDIFINGEPAQPGDPRIDVIRIGDGTDGHSSGVVYADEHAAAEHKVENYECQVVLTYENKNKSEAIKCHQQFFPLSREFKMATTIVNVDIALYDWCAHAWGIEAADWDNDIVFEVTFENTHVLGSPVEPSATGEIDLDAVLMAAKAQHPEIDGATLSWFNPTLNNVDRTVQYSVPRISNLCYMTPESETVRYDVFETTREYDLTFYLYASRYPGYTGEITYIIEAPEAPADATFTVSGSASADGMSFEPVAGEKGKWMLIASRSAFNGVEQPVMMLLNGGAAIASGLTVTGREAEDVVILTLGSLDRKLSVTYTDGIDTWGILTHDPSEMSAVTPGEKVTLFANLLGGYKRLRMTSEPSGLDYTSDGNKVTFIMPSHDVKVILHGVCQYQVEYLYNYGDLGVYLSDDVMDGYKIVKPAKDPAITGLTFAGWYDNAQCEGEPFDFSNRADGNITLYAGWHVNVTVNFGGAKGQAAYVADHRYEEIDGEQVEIIDSALIFPGDESEYVQFTYSTQKIGETALEIILPNYDGYDFFGWYLTPDYSGEQVNPAEYQLGGGVTFYARWERIAVLTYNLNYGEQEEPYALAIEYAGMPLQYIPEDPRREHYEFLGWFRTPEGNTSDRVNLKEYVAEGTMSLYASWKPVEYAIAYELNGGENHPGNPAFYTVESVGIEFYPPTRAGYEFIGWTLTGLDADDDAAYIPAGSAGNVTLTAAWDAIVYTISYDLGRGATQMPNPAEYTIESADITLGNPVADGYEFLGWTGTDLNEPTLNVVIPAGSIGNRSYTGNWVSVNSVSQILDAVLALIRSEYEYGADQWQDQNSLLETITGVIESDAFTAPYADRISVSVSAAEDSGETDKAHLYTFVVTVSCDDENGNAVSRTKRVSVTVAKRAVEITVLPAVGNLRYGQPLSQSSLTGGEASVAGTFRWANVNIVPKAQDNGKAIYRVVFTPDDSSVYATVEALVAVNTQIGVIVSIEAYEAENAGESIRCEYTLSDADTGAEITEIDLTGGEFAYEITESGDNIRAIFSGYELAGTEEHLALYVLLNETAIDLLYDGTLTVYTITYELNGGENHPDNPDSYTIQSGDIIFEEPTRTGYEFVGWEMTGISDPNNDGYLPAGSIGNVTMTAVWEIVTYAISYDLIRGETAQPNPTEYTIESADILLMEPVADGYEFLGWTGTCLTEPTLNVTIPAGSVDDRSYKANWMTSVPIGSIIESALATVPNEQSVNANDFTGIDNIQTEVIRAIAADAICAPYLADLTVTVSQNDEVREDDMTRVYFLTVSVAFTDDAGNVTSGTKNVTLTVQKNPVEITAGVSYPEGVAYIPYGTALGSIALGECTATSGGETVEGTFAWADPSVVPKGYYNGNDVYKVIFTPDEPEKYCPASIFVGVNMQIGLKVRIDAPDVEYMGRELDGLECSYYAVDADMGTKVDGANIIVNAATISQSQITPGTGIVITLTGIDCEVIDNNDSLYTIVSTDSADTITITRATPIIKGTTEYNADYGTLLRDIGTNLKAVNRLGGSDAEVEGVFEWVGSTTVLDTHGTYSYTVRFTPDDMVCYNTADIAVTVNVKKRTVQVPKITAVVYDGNHHIADVPESELYSAIYNQGGTDAGNYTVILSLTDSENYCWADSGTSADKRLTFTINPRELTVSGTASVMKLGYGQKLRYEQGDMSNDEWKTAGDMISGLTITDALSGETVTGEWIWDAANLSQPLNASAAGDVNDNGDGHTVEAYFVPTDDKPENYVGQRKAFTVQIARAVPDVSECGGYLPYGAIYQPASGTTVNALNEQEPVLTNMPRNPVTRVSLSSYSIDWEEPNRHPESTGYYNAVFTPTNDDGRNYTSVLVPIRVEIKHNVDIAISIDGGSELLYSGSTPTSNLVSSRNITQTPGSIRIALSHNMNGQPMYVSAVRVGFRNESGSSNFYQNTYYISNGQPKLDGEAYRGMFSVETVSYVEGNYGVYNIAFGGSATDAWNRKDLTIYIEMSALQTSSASRMVMMNTAPSTEPTIEPTAEPTAEPTVEPTVEPTAEPTVEPTAEPTIEPTAEPTAEPTVEPTVEPTAEPTVEPTAEPTVEPTAEPTVELTVEPTAEPAAEQEITPVQDEPVSLKAA